MLGVFSSCTGLETLPCVSRPGWGDICSKGWIGVCCFVATMFVRAVEHVYRGRIRIVSWAGKSMAFVSYIYIYIYQLV